jgi:hypothetical protein
MVVRLCRVDADPACGWSSHNFKHFPFGGMTKEHTLAPNPARYLPGFDAERIRAIETTTVRATTTRREPTHSKSEYLRDMLQSIGWDLGQDATLSFVECAGGDVARTFHGRPMCIENLKAASFRIGADQP